MLTEGRCDSFVLETNVHFPTDINLLYDSVRKMIETSVKIANKGGIPGWREHHSELKKNKKLFNKCREKGKNNSKNSDNRNLPYNETRTKSHNNYIDFARKIVLKSNKILLLANIIQYKRKSISDYLRAKRYIDYSNIFIDQINRRVLKGQSIPNEEKIYSIFEPHTAWLTKGKSKAPVELGVNICILEDQYGFILHHNVMENKVDSDITVSIVKETKEKFPDLDQCSFDRGFYSKENKKNLNSEITTLIMPKKGKRNQEETIEEMSEDFVAAKNRHSAIESAINAIETHGLDRCPDHGIIRFRRYVSIAVTARNIQQIGTILLLREKLKFRTIRQAA